VVALAEVRALALAVGVRVLWVAGVLTLREDAECVSAGIAISAPIRKKSAAMMTLGNCIASSR
jgi:hypothetical protein